MKYLVNRKTKEHFLPNYQFMTACDPWVAVEADDEGWIPWNGGECPLPDDCAVWVKIKGHEYGEDFANVWNWMDYELTAYRPILAEKEEFPQSIKSAAEQISRLQDAAFEQWLEESSVVKESLTTESVFDRLRNATEAAESIPAILAEINAMLPDGYCVTKREEPEQKETMIPGIGGVILTDSAEDMSDWRNWKEGDLVECVTDCVSLYSKGRVYEVKIPASNRDPYVMTKTDDNGTENGLHHKWLRFHSRPKK